MSILVQTTNGETAEFPDGTSPSVIQAAMAKQFGAPKQNDPTGPAAFNPATNSDQLTAGVGQGMSDAVLGAGQLLANSGPAQIAGKLTGGNPIADALAQTAAEKAKTDAPLLNTGAGKAGSVLGNLAVTGPLMPEAAGPGILAKIAQGMEGGAIAGVAQPGPDQAQNIALSAGLGGGISGAMGAAGKVLNTISNPVASAFNKAAGKDAFSPHAMEGEDLAQAGYQLTPAQITGSKQQAKLEQFTRNSLFGADPAWQVDNAAAQQWVNKIKETANGIGSSGERGDVGERLQGVVKNAMADLTQQRDAQAAKDFGVVRSLTQNSATIEPTNTNALLQQIASDNEGIGTPSGDALAKFANKQLSNVAPQTKLSGPEASLLQMVQSADPRDQTGLLNAFRQSAPDVVAKVEAAMNPGTTAPAQGNLDKLLQLRQYLSKVSGGQAKISGDNQDRRVATQLLGSIDADINDASDSLPGNVGQALKVANSNYANASKNIEGVSNSALGHLVGDDYANMFFANANGEHTFNSISGDKVFNGLMRMDPAQISMAKSLMKNYSPDTWQDVKATILDQALQRAQNSAPSAGAKTLAANTGTYINSLAKRPEDMNRLAMIFEPGEMDDVNRTLSAARRLADRTGSNPSGTTPMAEIAGLFHAIPRAFAGDPTAMGQIAAQVAAPKAMAKVMANDQGRALVRQISLLPPGSDRFRQLASQIAAIAGADSANAQSQEVQQ